MSTDGSAAAPEDAATREVSSERPGLESADPGAADSGTSTAESADRGVGGSVDTGTSGGAGSAGTGDPGGTAGSAGSGSGNSDPSDEGFVGGLLRDATITGLPGETGTPPAEPHAPEAQQERNEPVGSEPAVGDNPRGAD